jgi:hypothetical protein
MSGMNDEICEIVTSQKGNNKINVRGYLMVKERNVKDTYYWCCDRKKAVNCKGRAITKFSNNSHYLQKFVDHNHSPQASSSSVAKTVALIKQQAKETRNQPIQIIQDNLVNISENTAPIYHLKTLCVQESNALGILKCHLNHELLMKSIFQNSFDLQIMMIHF